MIRAELQGKISSRLDDAEAITAKISQLNGGIEKIVASKLKIGKP